jgi:hypothetical protein
MRYDHLAGAVGVSVTEALLGRGLVRERDGAYLMAPGGAAEFGGFGIDVDRLERLTRPLLRPAWTGASAAITLRAASAPR